MKVEKIRRKGFTVISNDVLNNTALSWKAKGIFAYLWSQSDSWNFYEVEVLKHSTDGKASLKAGLKELESAGYLKRYRVRDGKGFLRESKWILSEEPMSDFPTLDYPTLENRTLENRTLTNTNYNNTNNNNTNLNEDAVVDTSLVNIEDQQKQTTDCGGFAKAVDFYKTNFGLLNSYMAEELRHTYDEWSSQSEEPGGIIIKAMQIALAKNVRNWKFVCGVLRQWEGKARTLADAETLEVEHKNLQCRQREPRIVGADVKRNSEELDRLAKEQNAGIDMDAELAEIKRLKYEMGMQV